MSRLIGDLIFRPQKESGNVVHVSKKWKNSGNVTVTPSQHHSVWKSLIKSHRNLRKNTFLYEKYHFPGKRNNFPSKRINFPNKRINFPGKRNSVLGRSITIKNYLRFFATKYFPFVLSWRKWQSREVSVLVFNIPSLSFSPVSQVFLSSVASPRQVWSCDDHLFKTNNCHVAECERENRTFIANVRV